MKDYQINYKVGLVVFMFVLLPIMSVSEWGVNGGRIPEFVYSIIETKFFRDFISIWFGLQDVERALDSSGYSNLFEKIYLKIRIIVLFSLAIIPASVWLGIGMEAEFARSAKKMGITKDVIALRYFLFFLVPSLVCEIGMWGNNGTFYHETIVKNIEIHGLEYVDRDIWSFAYYRVGVNIMWALSISILLVYTKLVYKRKNANFDF